MQNERTTKLNNLGNEKKNDRDCQNYEVSEKQRNPVVYHISPQASGALFVLFRLGKPSLITNSKNSN